MLEHYLDVFIAFFSVFKQPVNFILKNDSFMCPPTLKL